MAQPDPCAICFTPVANYTTLRCCGQPCHVACVTQYHQNDQTLLCPRCQHVVPLSVLEVLHEEWKEDPEFVEHVKTDWKDNPVWYVFVMKTATPYKDSGENCAIRMSPTGKPSTFWGAPKPKPFHG